MEHVTQGTDFGVPVDWLNADTVDKCCQTLVDMCTSSSENGDAASVLFVSSLAITAALIRLNGPDSTQDSVRRAMGIGTKKNPWPPRDLAFFSLNSGAHWSLLVYFPSHNDSLFYHYDSGRHFPGGGNCGYALNVVRMLARVRLVPPVVKVVRDTRFPVQEGGIECGYYLVAAMANLLWHRRSRLNHRYMVTPMNFYNLDLLHTYGLPKLRQIVHTLLFNHDDNGNGNPSRAPVRRRRQTLPPEFLPPRRQQQTIFSSRAHAPFSFDTYDDDDDDGSSSSSSAWSSPPSSSSSDEQFSIARRRKNRNWTW